MNTEMTIKDMETIKATGEVFIIPNRAAIKDEFINAVIPSDVEDMLVSNDVTEDNPMFIECWIVSEELNTENLRDHGGKLYDGNRIMIHTKYIPATLFSGKKEGDVVTVKFFATKYSETLETIVLLEMELTLSQLKYRYKQHGKFEECFEKVTTPYM